MPSYIALVRKDPDSDYGIDFPDFPGCVTAMQAFAEVRRQYRNTLKKLAE
jgi:predicted RNase H-like HicB family nuclease